MSVKRHIAVLFHLGAIFAAQTLHASFITIETTTTVTVRENNVKVEVAVSNRGDEPAHNVIINADIEGRQSRGKPRDSLGVNEKYSVELTGSKEFKKPGRYPVIVTVEYTDANLYPFSAMSVTHFDFREAANARVIGIIPQQAISDKGRLNLNVNNIDIVERKISFRIVAPKEFLVSNPEGEMTMASGEERAVRIDMKNVAARPGSNYPVFALLGYDDDKYHYSYAAAGSLRVEESKPLLSRYEPFLIGVLVILASIVAFYNLKRFRNRGAKA